MNIYEKLAKHLGVEKITDELRTHAPDLEIESWHTADGYDLNVMTNQPGNPEWENDVYYYEIPFDDIIERISELDEWSTVYVSDLEQYLPEDEVECYLENETTK